MLNISLLSHKKFELIINLEKSKPVKQETQRKAAIKVPENLSQSLQKLRETQQEANK